MHSHNPIEALANMRHELGEHGGINMSIEASTIFTVMAEHSRRARAFAECLQRHGIKVGYTGSLEQRWDQHEDVLRTLDRETV